MLKRLLKHSQSFDAFMYSLWTSRIFISHLPISEIQEVTQKTWHLHSRIPGKSKAAKTQKQDLTRAENDVGINIIIFWNHKSERWAERPDPRCIKNKKQITTNCKQPLQPSQQRGKTSEAEKVIRQLQEEEKSLEIRPIPEEKWATWSQARLNNGIPLHIQTSPTCQVFRSTRGISKYTQIK